MRIWIGTWNCEQQFPTQVQFDTLVNHANGTAGAIANCDLAVMGFQESSRGAGIPNLPGFQNLMHLTAEGQTKNVENCQALFLWQNANAGGTVVNPNNPQDSSKDVTKRTLARKIKFWAEYGKGSANTCIVYRPNAPANALPWRIIVSSAHLDSFGAAKRTQQVTAAMAAATQLTHGNPWDVHFMMGDLNFRVNKTVNRLPVQLYGEIVGNRNALFADDSLSLDPVLGAAGPWTFPPPYQGAPGGALSLPTYKKIYKPNNLRVQAVNAATLLEAGGGNPMLHVPMVYDFKIDSKTGAVKEGTRAGQYDCGWLDRVGFRIRAGSGRAVNQVWSGSLASLVLSDHAPVYSVFDVT